MASGGLRELERIEGIKAVKERGGGPAEILKAFLENYRREQKFDTWTWEHMNDARFQVVKVWQKRQEHLKKRQLKRPLVPEGMLLSEPS